MDLPGSETEADHPSSIRHHPLSSSITFSTPSDLHPDLPSLLDLASRGQWRLLLSSLPSLPYPSSHPPHLRLLHSSLRALSHFKLRLFHDCVSFLHSIPLLSPADLDSPSFLFQSYPHIYSPPLSGSFVPFSLRLLLCLLPRHLGHRRDSVDHLYSLLSLARRKSPFSPIWHRRAAFIAATLISDHFSHCEFDVALSLISSLLQDDPDDPALLSRLAYIQLQIGDISGASTTFSRVESLCIPSSKSTENIVTRNRALMCIVAKDFSAAVRAYESCIERDVMDAVAINNKAICLMYSRDLSDGIKVMEAAMERVPTAAVNEMLVVNLCSMYELAYVNHVDIKKTLAAWIDKVAPDDFNTSCMRI